MTPLFRVTCRRSHMGHAEPICSKKLIFRKVCHTPMRPHWGDSSQTSILYPRNATRCAAHLSAAAKNCLHQRFLRHGLLCCSTSRLLQKQCLNPSSRPGSWQPRLRPTLCVSPLSGSAISLIQNGHSSTAGLLSHSHSGHVEHSSDISIDKEAHGEGSADTKAHGEGIIKVHSPQELAQILTDYPDSLVCLMCKAIGCRPCKVFARKYQRIAQAYHHCMFLECIGDETIELRKLMIQMGIRSTPTFRLYKQGECVKTHVGIDDQKLRTALDSCLGEGDTTAVVMEENTEGTRE